jgi:hypothetical protein
MTLEALILKLEERKKFLLDTLDEGNNTYINGKLDLLESVLYDLKNVLLNASN